MNRSHGGTGTPEYSAWKGMIQRCHNTKDKSYKNYGARGIRVCTEWRNSFAVFLDAIGKKPTSLHTVERINNDGNYEPGNVRWATRLEQNNNTRKNRFIESAGETKTLSQWSRQLNIPVTTLWHQLNRGGSSSLPA
jgi:hypothetical protein